MKLPLLATMLLVGLMSSNVAFAANPYDFSWTLNDGSSIPYQFDMASFFGSPDQHLIWIDPSTGQPGAIRLQTGLDVTSDTGGPFLEINGIQESQIQNLVSHLAGKASVSHTHGTSDINGLGAFVDGRIATGTPMVFATSTRSLNTAFQVSATKAAFVSYTVDVGATLSLLAGQTGTVTLEYADDSAFTTNVKTVQSSANGNTGTLTIGLNLTQTTTASLTGIIPKGKWVRISTANTTGTPTFTYRNQQEVLLPIQ